MVARLIPLPTAPWTHDHRDHFRELQKAVAEEANATGDQQTREMAEEIGLLAHRIGSLVFRKYTARFRKGYLKDDQRRDSHD